MWEGKNHHPGREAGKQQHQAQVSLTITCGHTLYSVKWFEKKKKKTISNFPEETEERAQQRKKGWFHTVNFKSVLNYSDCVLGFERW